MSELEDTLMLVRWNTDDVAAFVRHRRHVADITYAIATGSTIIMADGSSVSSANATALMQVLRDLHIECADLIAALPHAGRVGAPLTPEASRLRKDYCLMIREASD